MVGKKLSDYFVEADMRGWIDYIISDMQPGDVIEPREKPYEGVYLIRGRNIIPILTIEQYPKKKTKRGRRKRR